MVVDHHRRGQLVGGLRGLREPLDKILSMLARVMWPTIVCRWLLLLFTSPPNHLYR